MRTLVFLVTAGAAVTLAAASDRTSSNASTNGAALAQRLPRLEHLGGPFVRHPRIVTVSFASDDPAIVDKVERFGSTVTRTSWWRAVVEGACAAANDCIGRAQQAVSVRLPEALPTQLHAVEVSALLVDHARAGDLGLIDANSLFLVYLPRHVRLRDAFVPRYCDGPRAYHRALRFDVNAVGYAVMPRCGDGSGLVGTASHELVETAMNPDPAHPAFAFTHGSATRAFTAAGDEAVDPCGFLTIDSDVIENGFVLRRAWSNRAASQGRDPCVPSAPDRPFVALVPLQPAVRLAHDGDTVTIELEAAADRPVDRWSVSAVDLTGAQDGRRYVDVWLDRHEVTPGDTATLRLTRLRPHALQLSVVGIVSTVGAHSSLWPVAVVSR